MTHAKDHRSARGVRAIAALPAGLFLAAIGGVPAAVAQQEDACAFFQGRTVELVVPFGAGGGYDTYGRLVARHMGEELGAANMIVINQPGAGGLLATNQTYLAEPDGLLIQLVPVSGIVAAEQGGAEGARFDSNEFSWIGRISLEPDVVVKAPGSALETMDDIRALGEEREVRIASTGLGSPQYISINLLAEFLETDTSIVTGYSGAAEIFPSLARGEVDLFVSSLSAAEGAEAAETAEILWVFGTEPIDGRPEVPTLEEVIDERFHLLNEVHGDAIVAGRALAAPPGMDPARLQCLRDAFDRTMAGDALLAEAEQLNRPVQPLSGPELEALIRGATDDAPEDYLEILRSSFAQ